PGLPFIFGRQDSDFRFKAQQNNWLVTSNSLTTPYLQVRSEDISLKANVEPFRDFRIQLDAKKTTSGSFREIFRDTIPGDQVGFASLSPSRSGNYNISFLAIKTSFIKGNNSINSPIFEQFINNLDIIQGKLGAVTGYNFESRTQDVLIPAFIAAYSGQEAKTQSLSPFPALPFPNWRIDYNGLSKLPGLKEVFQSISIKHSYKSTFSIMNFTNSLEYGVNDGISLDFNVEDYNRDYFASIQNESGEIIPIYIISQVMITEQFAPLIGINFKTNKRLGVNFDYKKKRDIGLNLSNTQVTEVNNTDFAFEIEYTKDKFKLPWKFQGATLVLENDVQFRLNFNIRNTETIQRKIDEGSTITNGNLNFQLRPTISYVVSEKLFLSFYFDRTINEPKLSSTYARSTTRFGVQVRFSLAQ
ncbi:MAG: cell surface protein SprA, partial [Cyclobacteriaceae bacterium]|nr:cell surface protein SprA [Cyclobacteriaceae bacterium]